MNVFYKPTPGVVGDCIPYYYEGRYHVFYLRNYRDEDGYGIGSPWHHVSTTDFVDFRDHGEALPKGGETDQDIGVATGSVLTDDDGLHHIFYTGINPYFRTDDRREQAILHATSTDLDHWTKQPAAVWYSDEAVHERHDWRDPFVYRHPTSGRYVMLVAARTRVGEPTTRGCTAILESTDLVTWTHVRDYAPARYHGHECPDFFRMGDWYYLVFSEYTTHTATRYVMSRDPDGPWIAPSDNQFDNRAFYAAKSAGPDGGGPRYLFGWNPSKVDDRDDGEWQWGGALTVHQIEQRPDGTLSVRAPSTLLESFEPATPSVPSLPAGWTGDSELLTADALDGRVAVVLGSLPDAALFEGTLSFDGGEGHAGVLLDVDAEGHGGYFLRVDPALGVVQFGKVGGYRNWYVDHFPELDRPLRVRPGHPVRFRVIVDNSAVVAYLNDEVALSARMYHRPRGSYGIFADGAHVTFSGLQLRPRFS